MAILLPLIPTDKANHIIYGLVIYVLCNLVLVDIASLCVVALFGLAKELYDYKSYGRFDVLDLIATIVGALTLTITY
jgi:hypothetical protein